MPEIAKLWTRSFDTASSRSLPAEKPPVRRRAHGLDHGMIVEAWQGLKSLEQLTVASGALRYGAAAISPVKNPEHVRCEWSISGRDDLDLLQVSPGNSLDPAVWSLTNNFRLGQAHNETTLWFKAGSRLRSIPLGVQRTVECSGSHA
jgi:hypothetical protein